MPTSHPASLLMHSRHALRLLLATGTMMMLTGCRTPATIASAPATQPSAKPPTGLAGTLTGTAMSWGALVGQPQLDTWIANAMACSPAIEASRDAIHLAEQQAQQARAVRQPALDAGLALREGRRRNGMTGGATQDLDPLTYSIRARWQLDLFGQIRAQLGAAEHGAEARAHEWRHLELDLASQITALYLEGLYLQKAHHLRTEVVAAHETELAFLRSRVEAGLVREAEFEQAEGNRFDADRRVTSSAQEREEAAIRWDYLMASPTVPGLLALPDLLPELLPTLPPADHLHRTVAARPDVQAAAALARAAERTALAAARERLPQVTAMGVGEGAGPSPIEDPEEWEAWAGIQLSLPLLSPGRRAASKAAKAEANRQGTLYDDTLRRALMAVRIAYTERVHAEERWEAGRRKADRLKSRLDAVERQYRHGLVDRAELARTQRAWLDAKIDALRLFTTAFQAHLSLIREQGGE
jgi:outer membrane protein TolC